MCKEVESSQVLWLIYVNNLECDAFYSLKYADGTNFCKPCSVGNKWSNNYSMLLNSDKTDLMSISLSYSNNFDENISLVNVMIQPSDQKIKFEAIFNT